MGYLRGELGVPPPSMSVQEHRQTTTKPHINPSVLVIVIILSVVFLCSGILHILARCLGRRRAREPAGGLSSPSNSIRGQLQHLFSLHDSGVEQVFIDTLPVFLYGSIRGLKDSADCAVCLNEFANEDKLRLLPKCKHAFHTECIDTWLLSNSTCPLCRRSLLPDAEPVFPESTTAAISCAPTQPPDEQQQQHHSGSISHSGSIPHSGPIPSFHGSFRGRSFRASLRGSFRFLADSVTPSAPPPAPSQPEPPTAPSTELTLETPPMTPGPTVSVPQPDGSEKTLRVELGKVNIDSNRRISRDIGTSRMPRSYSMGSYEYVVDFSSLGLGTQPQPQATADASPSQKPTHRSTLSDGIPELSSASHTPGQEDMFWASRGLDTPHSLSRVREIMTPSPNWNASPLFLRSSSQKQKQQIVDQDENEDEDEDQGEIKVMARNPNSEDEDGSIVQRSLSLELLEDHHIDVYALQRSPIQELGAAARKDKVWEVSVDVSEPPPLASSSGIERSPSARKNASPLNWLRGRGRRLVYSAASPSSTDTQSTELKNPS